MSNASDVAAAGSENTSSAVLTDEQLTAFWNGILANSDAARRMAAHFVGAQDAEDVVHTAAIRFLESLQRPIEPAPFPKSDDELRRRFLKIISNHALDCIREPEGRGWSDHALWGVETEPAVGGHKTADRPLDRIFARNDTGNYDAPAEAEIRPQDNIDHLYGILRKAVSILPKRQGIIVSETFFEGRKRAEVAARLGISVKTYDNALQAAYKTLRFAMMHLSSRDGDVDRSIWSDRVEEMAVRYEAKLHARVLTNMRQVRKELVAAMESERAYMEKLDRLGESVGILDKSGASKGESAGQGALNLLERLMRKVAGSI